MTLTNVENLSAQELKTLSRTGCPDEVKNDPELGKRYLQARSDAKLRDERMAQQGALITELQVQSAAMRLELRGLTAKLTDSEYEREQLSNQVVRTENLAQQVDSLTEQTRLLTTQRDTARMALDVLKEQFTQRTAPKSLWQRIRNK